MELLVIALLAMLMVILLFFGIKGIMHRDVYVDRFKVQKYDPSQDEHIQKAKEYHKKKEKRKKIPFSQKITLILLGGFIFAALAYAVSGKGYIALIAMLGGLYIPRVFYKWQLKNEQRLITNQIEQAIEAMSMVMRSGGGMPEAIERAVENTNNPIKAELERVLYEIKLGKPEAEVLQKFAERINVPELEMLSISAELQRDGMPINIANVLNNMQSSIRTRQGYIDEVKAMTSENRLAVWIVSAIPFIMVAIIRPLMPEFRQVLFETAGGVVFSLFMFATIILGISWAFKIANVENL